MGKRYITSLFCRVNTIQPKQSHKCSATADESLYPSQPLVIRSMIYSDTQGKTIPTQNDEKCFADKNAVTRLGYQNKNWAHP